MYRRFQRLLGLACLPLVVAPFAEQRPHLMAAEGAVASEGEPSSDVERAIDAWRTAAANNAVRSRREELKGEWEILWTEFVSTAPTESERIETILSSLAEISIAYDYQTLTALCLPKKFVPDRRTLAVFALWKMEQLVRSTDKEGSPSVDRTTSRIGELSRDANANVRAFVYAVRTPFGEKPLSNYREALADPAAVVRATAISSLGIAAVFGHGGPEIEGPLCDGLFDPSEAVSYESLRWLVTSSWFLRTDQRAIHGVRNIIARRPIQPDSLDEALQFVSSRGAEASSALPEVVAAAIECAHSSQSDLLCKCLVAIDQLWSVPINLQHRS